jgi:hypothetical protein
MMCKIRVLRGGKSRSKMWRENPPKDYRSIEFRELCNKQIQLKGIDQ